jgi:hypothetical protein
MMNRNILMGLGLIAVAAVVLVLNAEATLNLDVGFTVIKRVSASMVLLGFSVLGVIVGVLLR